jgi:uncharacterized integral membrane protein
VVKIAKLPLDKIEKVVKLLLTLFAAYLIFQIVRKLLGGSWTTEEIILSLLVFILGAVFTIGMMMVQLKSDHGHLKDQFKSLANDFKSHIKKKK